MTDRNLRAVPEPDDFADLRSKLHDSQPVRSGTWKPVDLGPGAELAGTVTSARMVDGQYGSKPVLTVQTPDGAEHTVWGSHSVLRSELEKQPPAPNSRILIRYEGTGETQSGNTFHRYSVAVDKVLKNAGNDWVSTFNGAQPAVPQARTPKPSRGPTPTDLPF